MVSPWKETYRTIARTHYRFRDQRDNSGPGPINRAIENTIAYLVDRSGRNHAMWHAEQKYYDYWTDNSGIFKPFSPLIGLSAALNRQENEELDHSAVLSLPCWIRRWATGERRGRNS
mgnify:CR=1 FL=1